MKRFEIKEEQINDIMIIPVGAGEIDKCKIAISSLQETASKNYHLKEKYKIALEKLLNDLIILASDGQPVFGKYEEMNTNVSGMRINEGLGRLVEATKKDLGL